MIAIGSGGVGGTAMVTLGLALGVLMSVARAQRLAVPGLPKPL